MNRPGHSPRAAVRLSSAGVGGPAFAADGRGWAERPGWRRWLREWRWHGVLWMLLLPGRGRYLRTIPTLSGTMLIVLSLAIGIAAYNTGSNILFITLSLLLSSLVLSGVLSTWNFAGMVWRLQTEPRWRAGVDQTVGVELCNTKRLMPTYALWADLRTLSTPGSARLRMDARLDPRAVLRMEWTARPARRGREEIELVCMGSHFPFGFLGKTVGLGLRTSVVVWPAPLEYRRHAAGGLWRQSAGERSRRVGSGGDLLAVRRYAAGDARQLIHWKATARLRELMVRQVSAEGERGVVLWLGTPASLWPRPEQFELLMSLATTLAEDLFRAERLLAVALNTGEPQPVRTLRDLELFLDALAVAEPVPDETVRRPAAFQRASLLTFAPDGARGVCAYIDGNKAATA